jgi:hypothetical protein
MFFSFDKAKSVHYNDNLVGDKSGHLNDASVSGRAHPSSRTYGKKSLQVYYVPLMVCRITWLGCFIIFVYLLLDY